MVDPEIEVVALAYRFFMEEIKTRLRAIDEKMRKLSGLPYPGSFLDSEFAFLQLRFVCELIAFCALAAHKPMGVKNDLMKSWNARKTFETLARLNPQCFQRPAKITRLGNGRVHVDVNDAGALKRRDLQRIYDQCGEALHRGSLRHVFDGTPKVYDLAQLDEWAHQIGALLGTHALMILDKGLVLVVSLTGGPEGAVEIAITQAPGPSVYIPLEDRSDPRPAKSQRRPRAGKRPPRS